MTSITHSGNLFHPATPHFGPLEIIEELILTSELKVEKIISNGQATPEGHWYDQQQDEWVILLSGTATLKFENDEMMNLNAGDYILIPAHCRHRVEKTSPEPNCIWLAIHGRLNPDGI